MTGGDDGKLAAPFLCQFLLSPSCENQSLLDMRLFLTFALLLMDLQPPPFQIACLLGVHNTHCDEQNSLKPPARSTWSAETGEFRF